MEKNTGRSRESGKGTKQIKENRKRLKSEDTEEINPPLNFNVMFELIIM
jgi:hypothetical protein